MKTIYYFLLLINIIFISGCYKEIDLEKYRPVPKMVLNSLIYPDSTISASVSRTWFYTEDNPNVTLKDIDIDIYINDIYKGSMYWVEPAAAAEEEERFYNSKGVYKSSVIPSTGDKVKLIATGELGTITAESIIPQKAFIKNIDISYQRPDEDIAWMTYKITFQDSPEKNDYYIIYIQGFTNNMYVEFSFDYDPIFQSELSTIDKIISGGGVGREGGRVFSDQLINGEEYTLLIKERIQPYRHSIPSDPEAEKYIKAQYDREIRLYKISEDYYHHLFILQNLWNIFQYDLADIGLAEPIRMHSNVKGGTGMVGTYNMTLERVNLYELIPDYPSE